MKKKFGIRKSDRKCNYYNSPDIFAFKADFFI